MPHVLTIGGFQAPSPDGIVQSVEPVLENVIVESADNFVFALVVQENIIGTAYIGMPDLGPVGYHRSRSLSNNNGGELR